jgi:syntaxin 6
MNVEMDKTTKKMNFVQEKLGKLLKTNGINIIIIDMSQICTIIILFIIIVVMLFLVIYT